MQCIRKLVKFKKNIFKENAINTNITASFLYSRVIIIIRIIICTANKELYILALYIFMNNRPGYYLNVVGNWKQHHIS